MPYSTGMLANLAECDSLLALVAKEKSDLVFRKSNLIRQKENMSETGLEVDQDLASVNAELAAYQTIVATLPDGSAKEDAVRKLKRAELKLMTLTKKDRNYGTNSILMQEADIARCQREIDELDVFTGEINTRKAAL